MVHKTIYPLAASVAIGFALLVVFGLSIDKPAIARSEAAENARSENDRQIIAHAQRMITEGRQIFRFDTYGSEAFFGDALQLHKAIAGAKNGGVGQGVSPKTALAVGLKVDADALPNALKAQLKAGKVNLDDPATTLALLKLNAVVGLTGRFDDAGRITSLGTQCALCHSTVDDAFAPGIGRRLDGWANRDLNIGVIVSLAPNLKPFTDLLGVDEATVRKVLTSWGPGRYDAWLDKDGKAFRPDGGQAGTLIPPAFGHAGVNLHTWTGAGSVPYWNAYVAVTQQHGSGTFFDARLGNKDQYPVAAKSGSFNMGIDSFQADRSPTLMYRTAPLAGLWTHQKGGYYHDGRFATLQDVIEHYNRNFRLGLNDAEKGDLIEYLKSL
jgi:hypothetical protein